MPGHTFGMFFGGHEVFGHGFLTEGHRCNEHGPSSVLPDLTQRGFKCSQLLGRVICDHAWLGLDEEHYRLNAVARRRACRLCIQ